MGAEFNSKVRDANLKVRAGLWCRTYVGRMHGTKATGWKPPSLAVVAHTWAAAFLGIVAVAAPTLWFGLPQSADLFLIGSFGATAVLLYACPQSELAQPRNVIGGHFLAALVGVTAFKVAGDHMTLAAALAVATAAIVMQLTGTLHPPAGATALIAVLGPAKIQALGYRYAITPVLAGVVIMVLVALVFNNLSPYDRQHYPVSWF